MPGTDPGISPHAHVDVWLQTHSDLLEGSDENRHHDIAHARTVSTTAVLAVPRLLNPPELRS
jgi:hypothetical protein